jgi:uncharacterized protein (TIGR03083 family)
VGALRPSRVPTGRIDRWDRSNDVQRFGHPGASELMELSAPAAGIADELQGVVTMVAAIPEASWDLPTRCVPWNVRELVAHIAIPAKALANGLDALRRHLPHSAGGEPLPDDLGPAKIVLALQDRLHEVRAALARLNAEELGAILPPPAREGLRLPTATLLVLALVEIGVHRSDLSAALGQSDDLAPEVVAAVGEVVPAWLVFAASSAPRPDDVLTYALVGETVQVGFAYSAQGWSTGDVDPRATCCIIGHDSDLALFMLGRRRPDVASLAIVGDPATAEAFKKYLPGP